jgi:hypothetical protein
MLLCEALGDDAFRGARIYATDDDHALAQARGRCSPKQLENVPRAPRGFPQVDPGYQFGTTSAAPSSSGGTASPDRSPAWTC